ncbi:hypothetical protein Patl1_15593 [Pistacia atlantica]|uniref:Uncharacterized protein n=1 Tax=Pistacia atlantica TaxID=434234 RepID=A0ACC1B7I9_9ROSI|nr:hypothetical protein Patl1_15593 [Pistacia atlantica]
MEQKSYIKKKLRSKRPRLLRSKISPVLFNTDTKGISVLSGDSSSCTYFGGDEVSSSLRKRQFAEVNGETKKIENDAPLRRITRSSNEQQKENEWKGNEVEASESSCVFSNSGAVFAEISSKFNKGHENAKEIEQNGVSRSNDIFKFGASNWKISALLRHELSDNLKNDAADSCFTISNSDSVVEQRPGGSKSDSDLACTEELSHDDVCEYSSSHDTVFSELRFDFFPENSDLDLSDYTQSIFSFDSESQTSELSVDDTSPPSLTYSLFLEFSKQFSRSTVPLDSRKCSIVQEKHLHQSALVRFVNEEDEESYQRIRERERRQVFLYDYPDEYLSTTEYGDLIVQQRSQMVHWIVEQCSAKEFQQETMFLGVNLLDRFLSRGFFQAKRNLQIVGIACLVLATRLEENQPYNSVRQNTFSVESNIYSRNEVVAMEWLVQEVLNFQCFLPTIYNFLWFYLEAAGADAELERMAKYLAVLALSDHEQLSYWPSTVAAGLVILASLESRGESSYQKVIEIHVRTKDSDLPDCIKSLEWLLQYVS